MFHFVEGGQALCKKTQLAGSHYGTEYLKSIAFDILPYGNIIPNRSSTQRQRQKNPILFIPLGGQLSGAENVHGNGRHGVGNKIQTGLFCKNVGGN